VDQQEINKFLAETRVALMATINKDGSPQLTPNWYYYDGTQLTFVTTKDRTKFVNLRRDSRISVCIYDSPLASEYVVIRGRASIRDEGFWEDARHIISRYVEPERVDEYIERWKTQPRILVTVVPDRIYTRNQ
jgi:PPOX class probable F420-dependent enzyme